MLLTCLGAKSVLTNMKFLMAAVFRPHCYAWHTMRPIAAVVAWSVCLLDTLVKCAKTAEPIGLSFGVGT